MELPGLLILIAFLIVLFSFIIGVIIFKWIERKKTKESLEFERKISDKQIEQAEKFFSNEVAHFFKKQKEEYLAANTNTMNKDIGKMNKKYSDELKEIINSSQCKTILSMDDSKHFEKAKFLNVIIKESPFTWQKKFSKEIKEYYGEGE